LPTPQIKRRCNNEIWRISRHTQAKGCVRLLDTNEIQKIK
jgi:hypothetical protein